MPPPWFLDWTLHHDKIHPKVKRRIVGSQMSAEDLLKLLWDLQVPLAGGYAAYVLAYTGLRDRQKTVDVAFISLVFSLIATQECAALIIRNRNKRKR